MSPGADPRSAQPIPGPLRPRSDIGLYLSIVGFVFFAMGGIVAFLLMVRPWESEEPVAVDAGPPPEPDAGSDAGPPPPEVTTYRASLSESATVPYGGAPYCSYEGLFNQLEIQVVTTGADAEGRPIATGGRAAGTFTERATSRCPHPTVAPNPHELSFASAAYEGQELVVQFAQQSGAPPTTGTFRGTFTDGTLDGTLTLRRNEQLHPLLVFEIQAQMLLVAAE